MTVEEVEKRVILKVLVGSHIHGINVETSDEDVEAIIIEPLSEAMGIQAPFEELIRLGPDIKYVSLRKWCRLALKGNPNFLLPLFAPADKIIKIDARGEQLREMRDKFISKQAIKAHLGYMQGQRHRMQAGSNGGRGQPRQDKIDEFGFDTKYAMHLIRLAWQGWELAHTHKINLPVEEPMRTHLLDIRHGKIPLKDVLGEADELEKQMKSAFDHPLFELPEEPDYEAVEKKMLSFYLRKWSAERSHLDRMEDQKIRSLFNDPLSGDF